MRAGAGPSNASSKGRTGSDGNAFQIRSRARSVPAIPSSGRALSQNFRCSSESVSGASGSPGASCGPAFNISPSNSWTVIAARRRAGNSASRAGSIRTEVRCMSPSVAWSPRPDVIVEALISPVASTAATGNTREYCACSVVTGGSAASRAAAPNVSMVIASMDLPAMAPKSEEAAATAGWLHRTIGHGLK